MNDRCMGDKIKRVVCLIYLVINGNYWNKTFFLSFYIDYYLNNGVWHIELAANFHCFWLVQQIGDYYGIEQTES